MPDFDIVCLANSRKHQGRCVAGLRLDGEGWIRPVGWSAEGTLFPQHYILPDETEAGLLDVLRIPCLKPRPEPHHPENWLLGQGAWQLISRPAPEEVVSLLRQYLVSGPAILGSTAESVPFRHVQERPITQSLALVAPDTLHWIVRQKASGERQLRVAFTLGDASYDLPFTDQNWEPRLQNLSPGNYEKSVVGLEPDERTLLTISLSEPFQKEVTAEKICYKLVAASIVVPRGWKRMFP